MVGIIYNENCIETLSRMADNSVDFTITSPPYDDMDENFNPISKSGMRDYKGYTWDFKTIASELHRVTKVGGAVAWIMNDPVIKGSESLASCYQKIYFRKVGFNIYDTMIYAKNNPAPKNHRRYEQEFEYIFILTKGKPAVWNPIMEKTKYGGQKVTSNYRQGKKDDISVSHGHGKSYNNLKVKGNIWYYSVGWGHSYKEEYLRGFPAAFPEKLAEDLILSFTNPGDLVYDPFLGSGTSAKMAILNGRQWIGSEVSEEYRELAKRRTADAIAELEETVNV